MLYPWGTDFRGRLAAGEQLGRDKMAMGLTTAGMWRNVWVPYHFKSLFQSDKRFTLRMLQRTYLISWGGKEKGMEGGGRGSSSLAWWAEPVWSPSSV